HSMEAPLRRLGPSPGANLRSRRLYALFRLSPARGPEVVAPSLQSEGTFQSAELLHGLFDRPGGGTSALPCAGQLLRSLSDGGVPRLSLRAKLQNHGRVLALRQAPGLPEHHGPTSLLDLLGQPFEVFPCLRVGRQDPQPVVDHDRTDALETPPDRQPEA